LTDAVPARDPWTILRVLTWTADRFTRAGFGSSRLDAELLLGHALGVERIQLYTQHDKPLGAVELEAIRALVRRRLAREPVAYLTGKKEFWSLELQVSAAVLIPRPETELLVEIALRLARRSSATTIVDVGTGSGAIALALAKELPAVTVLGLDRSLEALEVARGNGARLGLPLALREGDLLDALPDDLVPDLIVANLPYIARGELASLAPEIREWEPRLALDGGEDGLDAIRRLIPEAALRLRPGGALALEHGSGQAPAVRELLEAAGFVDVCVERDLAGLERVTWGTRPPS
jgi:release factor glutamine methyltransferase